MQNRYSLRFDSGERQGETVPLTGKGFVVGRKPGSSLQIVDGSVSGRHAELDVHEDHVILRDDGSTNGTRIGTQRVLEERLHHGDKVLFGNVQLTFLDSQAGAVDTAAVADDEPELGSISQEKLAASRKRSIVPMILIVVLIGVLAGVWYFAQQGGGKERTIRPVETVAGNRLDGYSFEGELLLWSAHESSSADFLRNDSAAYSGETGLRASTAEGEWALHRSEEVTVTASSNIEVRGLIDAGDGAKARLGLEFSRPAAEGEEVDEKHDLFCWSTELTNTEGFEPVEFSAQTPEGYSIVRAVVFATGDGRVDVDDVSLKSGSGGAADFRVGEFELRTLGEAKSVAVLHKVDRFLISDFAVVTDQAKGLLHGLGSALNVSAEGEKGLRIGFTGSALRFAIEPDAVENGIATIGEGGYQVHSADFKREGVKSLLIGFRKDLVRLRFASPVKLTARPLGRRLRVKVEGITGPCEMQLDFREERVEAGNLAYLARKQETDGEFGPCIKTWTQLLDDYPYESALVAEAEEVRARLTGNGLREVRAVSLELERGSFFRLVEIYWQCRDKARAIEARYAGTEVAVAAAEVVAEVHRDVADLERDLQSYERGRLDGIRRALLATESSALAGEVERYLNENFSEGN